MVKNIISLILLLTTVGLHFKHGWDAFNKPTFQQLNMVSKLGLGESAIPYIGICVLLLGIILLVPKTYFIGNILNALVILMIISFAVMDANYKIVLIEIPFLLIPFLMIWLKYPFIDKINSESKIVKN